MPSRHYKILKPETLKDVAKWSLQSCILISLHSRKWLFLQCSSCKKLEELKRAMAFCTKHVPYIVKFNEIEYVF